MNKEEEQYYFLHGHLPPPLCEECKNLGIWRTWGTDNPDTQRNSIRYVQRRYVFDGNRWRPEAEFWQYPTPDIRAGFPEEVWTYEELPGGPLNRFPYSLSS